MRRHVGLALARLGLLGLLMLGCRSYDAGRLAADAGEEPSHDAGDASRPGECELLPAERESPSDRDDDGLPDIVERQHGFDPDSPDSPARDRVVYLTQRAAEAATAVVDVWVDGEDYVYEGRFQSLGTNDRAGWSAADFYTGSEAEGGEPRDHVLRIEPSSARIGPVRGTTRLRYSARFAFVGREARACQVVLPFGYVLDREDDRLLNAQPRYLLVLVPEDQDRRSVWCLPAECS